MKYKKAKNIFLRSRANLRKRRKSKAKKKQRNILNNRPSAYKNERVYKNPYNKRIENITIDGGDDFDLIGNPDNVIDVVNALTKYKKKSNSARNISIDLSRIESIDIGAINLLLAKINELSKVKKLRILGEMPKNEKCKKMFMESGFLDYMTDLSGHKFTRNSDNFIVSVGSDKTLNDKVGRTIEKSMKFLTGTEQKYPPVYSIIQEICSNSVEWANAPSSKSKNWLLGIQLQTIDNIPSVNFSLTDIGYGILHTLNRKFGIIIRESLGNISDTEILMRAFDRKYGSKSGEPNRNKGMPLIKNRFEMHYICNLKVITNNVLLDFADNNKTKCMNRNLPGTLYSWCIDPQCIETWNRKLSK